MLFLYKNSILQINNFNVWSLQKTRGSINDMINIVELSVAFFFRGHGRERGLVLVVQNRFGEKLERFLETRLGKVNRCF